MMSVEMVRLPQMTIMMMTMMSNAQAPKTGLSRRPQHPPPIRRPPPSTQVCPQVPREPPPLRLLNMPLLLLPLLGIVNAIVRPNRNRCRT